jgi:hypothetical protein
MLTVSNNCGSGSFAAPPIPIGSPTATVSGSANVAPNQSVPIQAALTGTAPWYVTWSDGYQQTVSAGGPATASRQVSVSTTTTFTVTSISDAHCAGTASGSAVITVISVPAPTNFQGAVSSATSLTLSWSPVSNATYVVYRDSAPLPATGSTSYIDTVGSQTAHVYTVRAVVSGVQSSDSNRLLETTVVFHPSSTNKILVGDITDLRTAVNAVRALANTIVSCPPVTFTDPGLVSGQPVKGVHVQELRSALKTARDILQFPALSYQNADVNPATNGGHNYPIYLVDMTSLRGGVQ